KPEVIRLLGALGLKNLNLLKIYAINYIDINMIGAMVNGCQPKGDAYENRPRNRPILSRCDLPCFRPERLPELHSPSPAGGHRGTIHGRPVCLALPVGDLRVSAPSSGTSAGQP